SNQVSKPIRRKKLQEVLLGRSNPQRSMLPMAGTGQRQMHVLLAEDNPVNRMVATRLLESRGHQVFSVSNGQEALEAIKGTSFDLVLMDCQMPVMDGFRASMLVREYEATHGIRRTPIVALTANALAGDRERCMEVGMDDYLSKPVRPESLDAALQKW